MIEIRDARKSDAEALLNLFGKLDSETDQMLFEPGERQTNVRQQEKILETIEENPRFTYLVADSGVIRGFCVIAPGKQKRNCHVGSLVIGVERSSWSNRIGDSLLRQALKKAQDAGITRVELTVRTDNQRAIALYEKHGFLREGERVSSLIINGVPRNEYYMAIVLPKDS